MDLCSIDWNKCLASDLFRAAKTAEKIFSGDVILMKNLREVRPYPIFKKNIKLPFLLWIILVKIAWLISHESQLESISDFKRRINAVLDEILSGDEGNILIVSHGALLMYMRKELLNRGFKGPRFNTPANGKLYVYESL